MRRALTILNLGLWLMVAWLILERLARPALVPGPGLYQVQHLAALVSLRVELADVQQTMVSGYTGAATALLLIRGDCLLSVDLSQGRLEQVDRQQNRAVLVLPRPTALSPRLDHHRSRLYAISSQGLWLIVPSDAGKQAAINRAYAVAQQRLQELAGDPDLVQRAQDHAAGLITAFYRSLGWQVRIRWQ